VGRERRDTNAAALVTEWDTLEVRARAALREEAVRERVDVVRALRAKRFPPRALVRLVLRRDGASEATLAATCESMR
jgi:hypothetical protein